MTATLFAVARSPLSSISDARSGSNASDLPVHPAAAAGRVVDLGEQTLVERDAPLRPGLPSRRSSAIACAMLTRFAAIRIVPRHAVGVAHLLGELVDKALVLFGCHRGDLVCDPVLADRRPARDDVGQRHRPTPRPLPSAQAERAARSTPRRCPRRLRRRLRQAGRGTRRSASSSTSRVYRRAAAGERNQQRGRGTAGDGAVVGDHESLGPSRADQIQHVFPRRSDLRGAVPGGDRGSDQAPGRAPCRPRRSSLRGRGRPRRPTRSRSRGCHRFRAPTASTRACRSAAAASQASANSQERFRLPRLGLWDGRPVTAGRSDRRSAGRRARTRRPTYVPRPPTRACSRRRR